MRIALLLVLALVACRPRQAAPADRIDSWSDDEGTFHIGQRPPPKDARLWRSGDEDFHRIGARCLAPTGAVIACKD
jgi:hypothetical protein